MDQPNRQSQAKPQVEAWSSLTFQTITKMEIKRSKEGRVEEATRNTNLRTSSQLHSTRYCSPSERVYYYLPLRPSACFCLHASIQHQGPTSICTNSSPVPLLHMLSSSYSLQSPLRGRQQSYRPLKVSNRHPPFVRTKKNRP